ncbi:MAG: site-2 protease family protein [Blastocatellia bacterium]|nr:site-2 protease family protein [Blastocatellia bacterium]
MKPRQIFQIFGIPVRVDGSWVLIFFTYIWIISTVYLPGFTPGLSRWLYFVFGTLTTILFFTSILLHELAHSLVARREGIRIHHITLYLFGGIARLNREPSTPKGEFLIAVAGPAASLGLGGCFLLVELGTASSHTVPLLQPIFHHLGWINIILGGFNLFPAFPLDGGRILRAFLWFRTGHHTNATNVTLTLSKWVGWGSLGCGVATWTSAPQFALSSLFFGVLLLSFLATVKPTESTALPLTPAPPESHLAAPPAKWFATTFVSLEPETPVSEVEVLRKQFPTCQSCPVIHNQRLYGLLNLKALPLNGSTTGTTPVREFMEPVQESFFVDSRSPLHQWEAAALRNGFGAIAVLDADGLVVGFVNLEQIRLYLTEK